MNHWGRIRVCGKAAPRRSRCIRRCGRPSASGDIWRGELVNRRKDGTLYDAALTIAPVFDIDGKISGYVGVQRDISHQKELDRLKDEFVSNVSHELRTPIANVKLYISLLTRGKPEKYDDYLQTLRREAARLEKLIEDLLDLSRLDLGRRPITLAPTDVNQLAAQLITDRTALAASRKLLIDYRTDSPLSYAQADSAMLSQVMSNLLTNAINYTPAGGVITVTTATRRARRSNLDHDHRAGYRPGHFATRSRAPLRALLPRRSRAQIRRAGHRPGSGHLGADHEQTGRLDHAWTVSRRRRSFHGVAETGRRGALQR